MKPEFGWFCTSRYQRRSPVLQQACFAIWLGGEIDTDYLNNSA
jgi:hypothetical protein